MGTFTVVTRNSSVVADAINKKNDLLSLYRETIADWELDLRLGDISAEDLAKLKAWRDWRKAVEAVDTSVASEEVQIEWPEQPAS